MPIVTYRIPIGDTVRILVDGERFVECTVAEIDDILRNGGWR